ncbi:hypothetical protein J0S82_007053 [Galemys pyrenaicus]|uniref:Uncharacterized protein n=1 Tax=Galemys pyrenaicus TaxID=202257 RepID=A0A8J6A6N2_GALPY|nr:hypothetical protein J0S82_007053 [Galemys pyrenaicus]
MQNVFWETTQIWRNCCLILSRRVDIVSTWVGLTEIRDMLLVNKLGYPVVVSIPHSIISGCKCVLALSVETENILFHLLKRSRLS